MKYARAALALLALLVAGANASADETEILPVAAITIYPGQAITDAMLTERAFIAGTSAQYPVAANRINLVGKVARRTLLPGKLVLTNTIGDPYLVSRGAIVQAVFQTPGMVIATPVLALQAGSLDDIIQIRNIDTGKVIVGVVQADGSVRVGG